MIKISNLVVFIVVLTTSVVCNAQNMNKGGNNGKRQHQGQNANDIPAFNINNVIGIIDYKVKTVLKKTKIKEDKLKTEVANIITDYKSSVDKIKLNNSKKLGETERLVLKIMEMKDRESTKNIRREASKQLAPIRKQILKTERKMNSQLEGILSEKQFKKFKNYQEFKKEELKPKRPQGRSSNSGIKSQRGSISTRDRGMSNSSQAGIKRN